MSLEKRVQELEIKVQALMNVAQEQAKFSIEIKETFKAIKEIMVKDITNLEELLKKLEKD